MGNLCKTCNICHKEQKNITILLVGLDNAGKTTIAKMLAGEPVDSVLKTVGFSLIELYYHNYKITLYDLGGSSNIRDIWSKYYMDAHGIIYVVDGCDLSRFEESKRVLINLLSHENICGKHVLLLAHKQDKEHALDELEIVEQMNLEHIVNKYKCPTRVEASTAIGLQKKKIDQGMKNGLSWLINTIIENYKVINDRVHQDMANYAFTVEKSREEWRKKMKLRMNLPEDATTVENRNPFQPIDSVIAHSEQKTSNYKNGEVIKPILINNFVKNQGHLQKVSFENGNNAENSLFATMTTHLEEGKTKLRQRYHKHKRKFGRFNKTAPMPMDTLIQGKSINGETADKIVQPTKQHINYLEQTVIPPRTYLIRRPATAPPKINLTKLKKERIRNFDVLSQNFHSATSTDNEDIISYF